MKSLISLSLLLLLTVSCGHHGYKEGGCGGCNDKQCEMKGKKEGAKCHESGKESDKDDKKPEAVEAKK